MPFYLEDLEQAKISQEVIITGELVETVAILIYSLKT